MESVSTVEPNQKGGKAMNIINAIVSNGKIEIQAPSELPDGSPVSVLVVGLPMNSELMSADETASTVQAMDLFAATFPSQEDGEDLSAAARTTGEQEKKAFFEQADKFARMFD